MALAGFYDEELFDTNGKALKLATVEVRNTNGTLATLYSAATMGSTIANPTQADSRGNVSFWAQNGEYDLVVTPQGGTAQPAYRVRTTLAPGLSAEHLPAPATGGLAAGTVGSQLGTLDTNFTVVRQAKFYARKYGAVFDGATNDQPALAAALADIKATRGHGTIVLEDGDALLGSTFTIDTSDVILEGGPDSRLLRAAATAYPLVKILGPAGDPNLYLRRNAVYNVRFGGNGVYGSGAGADALHIENAIEWEADGVHCRQNGGTGLRLVETFTGRWFGGTIVQCSDRGILMLALCNDLHFHSMRVQGCTGAGVETSGIGRRSGVQFHGCNVEGNSGPGLLFSATGEHYGWLYTGRMEGNGTSTTPGLPSIDIPLDAVVQDLTLVADLNGALTQQYAIRCASANAAIVIAGGKRRNYTVSEPTLLNVTAGSLTDMSAGLVRVYRTGLANAFAVRRPGEANDRFLVTSAGEVLSGGGGAAPNKVLGARGAAVAAAVNAAAAPTQAEFNALVSVVNALRDRLRVTGGHGLFGD